MAQREDVVVWESSHVGGDRFAANIVCLPHGVYFGRVEADEADGLLAAYRRGELVLDRYRGRSCLPPLVQSAELFIRRALDETRVDGLTFEGVQRDGDDRLTARFRVGDRVASATVTRHRGDAVQLTCSAGAPSPPWRYDLESLELLD